MNEPNHAAHLEDPSEIASLWCIRLSEGDMNDADWSAFEEWHRQPGSPELLQKAIAVWQACGDIGNAPEIIPLRAEALTKFHDANRIRWQAIGRLRWPRFVAIAASLALVASLSVYLLSDGATVYETAIGEHRVAALSDGTRISLDAVSEVEVTMEDAARSVELRKGRALFDVAKDPLRPFTVAAGDKLIVAIGTSFSVELVQGQVQVMLYEGKVEVRDRSDTAPRGGSIGDRQTLVAGQGLVDVIGSEMPARIAPLADERSLAWEQGMLSFEGDSLASAIERMNRNSSRSIRLADPALGRLPVDGEFLAGDPEAFVEGVATINDLKVTRTQNEIILRRR